MSTLSKIAALALFLAACGGSGGGAGNDGGTGGSDAGNDGEDCTTVSNCTGGAVCDPGTGECVSDLPCTDHAECGVGGHCNEAGQCEPNSTGGTCEMDMSCPSGEQCVGGFCGCEGVAFQAEPVFPNILIVLDRSGSMDRGDFNGDSKWEVATEALSQILGDYGDMVNFGLVLYAANNDCAPGQVEVDVAAGSVAAINSAIDDANPSGNTPIGDTLDGLVGYSGLSDPSQPNYVLLLTDGEETCGGEGTDAVTALRAQSPEVKTFVVGFGDGVDSGELNDMAEAGGTALAGNPSYYQADDAIQLATAFDTIVGTVLSCTYALSGDAGNGDDLYVYFDGQSVGRDMSQTDGWDYDPDTNQVTFYGPSCDALSAGEVTDLAIVYGCPVGPIE